MSKKLIKPHNRSAQPKSQTKSQVNPSKRSLGKTTERQSSRKRAGKTNMSNDKTPNTGAPAKPGAPVAPAPSRTGTGTPGRKAGESTNQAHVVGRQDVLSGVNESPAGQHPRSRVQGAMTSTPGDPVSGLGGPTVRSNEEIQAMQDAKTEAARQMGYPEGANPVLVEPQNIKPLPSDKNTNPATRGAVKASAVNKGVPHVEPGEVQTTIDSETTTIHPNSTINNWVEPTGEPHELSDEEVTEKARFELQFGPGAITKPQQVENEKRDSAKAQTASGTQRK
jgi:hypothetical protein